VGFRKGNHQGNSPFAAAKVADELLVRLHRVLLHDGEDIGAFDLDRGGLELAKGTAYLGEEEVFRGGLNSFEKSAADDRALPRRAGEEKIHAGILEANGPAECLEAWERDLIERKGRKSVLEELENKGVMGNSNGQKVKIQV